MSDKEIILNSLQTVERRIRANQCFKDGSFALVLFLVFPLAFKIVDLFHPFQATTVFPVLAVWLIALLTYCFVLFRRKGTLAQAAASIDKRLVLHDSIKTAYWFMEQPRRTDRVDGQLQRAAGSIRTLDVKRLYPSTVPRSSFIA